MSNEKLWWYSKNDERFGPHTAVELKEIAATGQITATDMVWKEGLPNWLPASKIKGLVSTAVPSEPPPLPSKAQGTPPIKAAAKVTEAQANKTTTRKILSKDHPAVWNPNALANWSILLTPLFGAYFVTENYKAMGLSKEAKKSMEWFYIGIAVMLSPILLSAVFPVAGFIVALIAYVIYLISWYFLSARKQHGVVMAAYGKNYERQPWGKILAIGIAAQIVWQAALRFLL